MRLLLTGADGQVGWELRRSLMPLGEVIALDRKACDLSRPHDLSQIIREVKPDTIINAAAYTNVDQAEEEEPLATLINGTAAGVIAETARQIGALLIHYSTDYVFDGTKASAYTEDDRPQPINAYGRSKLAGEHAIQLCDARSLILRTSWIYSARGRNFLRTILKLVHERGELRIVDDQIGAPTWAREVADATARIVRVARNELEKGDFASSIFNVTAGGATSWFGFAQAIVDQISGQTKAKIHPISSSEYPSRAERPKNSRLAGDRLQERFGITLADWKQALTCCMRT